MANNLFISYDLMAPGKDYEAVYTAIKSLGGWAKVHKSVWYVNSAKTAQEAVDVVWRHMDTNDKLIVINATTNNAAWKNMSDDVSKYIIDQWNK